MNIRRLIDDLEELAEEFGDESEVLIAFQPNWPLTFSINNVKALPDCEDNSADPDYDEEFEFADDDVPHVIWIAASDGHPYNRNPYAPRRAWERY